MGNAEMMELARRRREAGQTGVVPQLPDNSIGAKLNRNVLEPLVKREEDDSLLKNFAKNASLFAIGLPIAATKITGGILKGAYQGITGDFAGASETVVKPVVEGIKSAAGSTAAALGLGGSEKAAAYWKNDPLFAALDATGAGSLVAGLTKGTVVRSVLSAASESTVKSAALAGVEEVVVRSVLGSKTVTRAISAIEKEGAVGILKEVTEASLRKAGITDDVAKGVAEGYSSAVRAGLKAKAGSLGVLDAIEHPLKAGLGVVGKVKATTFGTPSQSAVVTLYGAEKVAEDPQRYLGVERWLEAQTVERGLKNTRENRLRIHAEWVRDNPDYAILTPEQRLTHFDNYITADEISRKLSTAENDRALAILIAEQVNEGALDTSKYADKIFLATSESEVVRLYKEAISAEGSTIKVPASIKRFLETSRPSGTEVVPVRVLPEFVTDAMNETVGVLKGALGVGEGSVEKMFSLLEQHFPREMGVFKQELSAMVKGLTGDEALNALQAAITRLSKRVHARSYNDFSPEVRALATQMTDETMYRAGIPPQNRPISRASIPLTDKTSSISVDDLYGKEGVAGRFLEGLGIGKKRISTRLGLSSAPTPPGIERAAWSENFLRGLRGLSHRHGTTVKLAYGDSVVTVPTTGLLQWLEANFENIATKAEGRSVSMTLAPPRFIYDLIDEQFLKTVGIKGRLAQDLVALSKKSLAEVPIEYTGLAEKFTNFLRTRNSGFSGFLSSGFNKALRVAYTARYNSRLALMYSAQQFLESRIWQTLYGGGIGRNLEAVPRYGPNFLKRLTGTESLIGRNLSEAGERDMMRVHGLMRAEVLPEISPNSPDVMLTRFDPSVKLDIKNSAKFARSTASENFWYNLTGNSHLKEMTGFARNYLERFNMTLEDALETVTTANGNLKYRNPAVVENLRDTLTNVFAYRQGFLTSPLAKTMNAVFFPFRFNAKTVALTTEWLNSLPPVTRATTLRTWTEFSRWAGTEEGIKWRKKNDDIFYAILNYATPAAQIDKTIAAVSEGKLFDGRTGMIGGLPFGWLYNIAQNMAIAPEVSDSSTVTGKPYQHKMPKKPVSLATFNMAMQELLGVMAPSFPVYELSRGKLSGLSKFSPRNFTNELSSYLTAGLSLAFKEIQGKDSTLSKERQAIERGMKPRR